MIQISMMDKAEKTLWLPRMFDLLYENMKQIAPSSLDYEAERFEFLENVSPALDKELRQVLLAVEDGTLVGYVQYYTRQELLMVEEVQIRKDHQNSFLFLGLCRKLMKLLPGEIDVVEAYADVRNLRSRKFMERLGMTELPESGHFVHLRGDANTMKKIFGISGQTIR